MHEQLVAVLEQVVELGVERPQPAVALVGLERAVPVRQVELVVVVQVVRRLDDRDRVVEPVLANPDDLLLTPHPTVVVAVAAGTFADRQLVLEDPGEMAGHDAECPLAAQLRGHQRSPSVVASVIGIMAGVQHYRSGRTMRKC